MEQGLRLKIGKLRRFKAFVSGGINWGGVLLLGFGLIWTAYNVFSGIPGFRNPARFDDLQTTAAIVGAEALLAGLAIITARRFFRQLLVFLATGLLFLLFVQESTLLANVRNSKLNQDYSRVLQVIEEVTSPNDVIASNYPQLITCMTGRRSIGTSFLTENLEGIIKKFAPDYILVEEARMEAGEVHKNYTTLGKKSNWTIPGYAPVVHNAAERYILFRSLGHKVRENQD